MSPLPSAPSPRMLSIAREHPVFDAHADSLQRALDLGHDLGVRGPGQLDLERGLEGGLGALVFVAWVDPKHIGQPGGASGRARALLREFHKLAARRPDRVRFAGNARQLESARRAGAVGGIPGIEGGHAIEESLERLDEFFEHGVRVLTLVWNNHLSWIRSCKEGAGKDVPEGLSPFGREVVKHMNRLGMVVDLSHAGKRAFLEALEASDHPAIASHSGCQSVSDHPRNLDDEQLRALGQRDGVVGIAFCPAFLDEDARASERQLREGEAYRSIRGENDTDTFVQQSRFLERELRPLSAERVVDHIVHAALVAGIEHVGLGSDYDGIERAPKGLEDASRYMTVAELMRRRGFHEDEIRMVLGDNLRRAYELVTGPGTRAATAVLAPL